MPNLSSIVDALFSHLGVMSDNGMTSLFESINTTIQANTDIACLAVFFTCVMAKYLRDAFVESDNIIYLKRQKFTEIAGIPLNNVNINKIAELWEELQDYERYTTCFPKSFKGLYAEGVLLTEEVPIPMEIFKSSIHAEWYDREESLKEFFKHHNVMELIAAKPLYERLLSSHKRIFRNPIMSYVSRLIS